MPFMDTPDPTTRDEFLDPVEERAELTDELLAIGRELADLPEDGAFGRKVDLRERQKELRQRLAELDDLPADGRDPEGDRVIDLEHDELVDSRPPNDLFRY